MRNLYAGNIKIPLPPNFFKGVKNRALFSIDLPTRLTLPVRITSTLQEEVPKIKREAAGDAPAAQARASKIEVAMNAVMAEKGHWKRQIDLLLNQGEIASTVTLSTAAWKKAPDYFDSLDYDEWARLPQSMQDRYEPHDLEPGRFVEYEPRNNGSTRMKKPSPRYDRDAKGRDREDPNFDKRDEAASERAWREERDDYLARNLPVEIRVMPADDVVPIWDDGKLEGLLIRTALNREQLIRRRYIWGEDAFLQRARLGDLGGQQHYHGGDCIQYEYWHYDERGHPGVIYSIDGLPTKTFRENRDGSGYDKVDAYIDFYEESGLTELPAAYTFGMHLEASDPQNPDQPLGIPFALPLIGALLARNMVATGVSFHAWAYGFPGYAQKLDQKILEGNPKAAALMMERGRPRVIDVVPGGVIPVLGELEPLVPPPIGPAVSALMQIISGSLNTEAPPLAATGGPGATSGHERSIIEDQAFTNLSQVTDGGLELWVWQAMKALELLCWLAKVTGRKVPIYAAAPQATKPGAREKRNLVYLDPDWVGRSYHLTAYFPPNFGQKLAQSQQLLEAWLKKAVTFREMREKGFDDEAPEKTRAELIIDAYLESPDGVAEVMELAAQEAGDERMAEIFQLKAQGDLTESGAPAAITAGLPAQPAGAMPGMQLPNVGASAVQGITQGAMGTPQMVNDAVAGAGPQPPAEPPGA